MHQYTATHVYVASSRDTYALELGTTSVKLQDSKCAIPLKHNAITPIRRSGCSRLMLWTMCKDSGSDADGVSRAWRSCTADEMSKRRDIAYACVGLVLETPSACVGLALETLSITPSSYSTRSAARSACDKFQTLVRSSTPITRRCNGSAHSPRSLSSLRGAPTPGP